ncbi:DUF6528 family protein [Compostibacter hankyongensis]|uniref:DUF6528 family protein n=1 Tax=Compostibacter hankyongensis TaxID=1007089 RepID=A0ABP8FRD4_9BACT
MQKKFTSFHYLLTGILLLAAACGRGTGHSAGDAGPSGDTASLGDCTKCIVIAEQRSHGIDIVNTETGSIVWSWHASLDPAIRPEDTGWFSTPDDAKPVYGNRYILLNASGGGVALVRVADKRAVFYAHAGKNPHSSELLPDGNIVTASSTDNRLVLFHVDTLSSPGKIYRKVIPLPFAHNVVWDKKRQLLWSAARNKLYAFRYNGNCKRPDLTCADSLMLPDTDAHDLFPVYGKDLLWLTTLKDTYRVDPAGRSVTPVAGKYTRNIKSVSSGPEGFPVIIILPKEKWWTDEVLDREGNTVFSEAGLKIYKARWFLQNTFSYGDNTDLKICVP